MQNRLFAILIWATFSITIISCSYGKLLSENVEQMVSNGIVNPPPARISGFRTKDWIKISEAPPSVVNTQFGERVEIECEVLGSPTPEIQWLRGNQVIQQTERIDSSVQNLAPNAYHDRAGLAKLRSRLVIDCVTSRHQGFYTCLAKAGSKKVKSEPTLILIEGGASESCKEPVQKRIRQPRIITWNPTAMENMGVDVLLPCVAEGNPPPNVYWLDQDNKLMDNFRFQTLSNGDLAIYKLSWPDMGQYTCVAENSAGMDSVTTFIYPVLNEK